MEVEVKLRFPDCTAHQSFSSLLSPYFVQTHFQHNIFFDGVNSELSSQRAVLRIRFYGEDPEMAEHCVVSLKAKAVLVGGVSRVEEDEEELDSDVGRAIWADPSRIGSFESRVLKRVREEFGVKEESGGYVCLGGFKNVRGVYDWNGLKLEVDETLFDFGTLYEVECESAEPEKVKEMIEGFLKKNGISYSYSKLSKFAIFRAGKLPPMLSWHFDESPFSMHHIPIMEYGRCSLWVLWLERNAEVEGSLLGITVDSRCRSLVFLFSY